MAFFVAVGPAILWRGGTMEREATTFIRQYTDDRPVLRKVFDPRKNDWGTYQARELSYFFDYIDAVVYRFIYQTFDTAVFIPLSGVLASLLLTLVFFGGVSRTTENVDPLTAALLFGCIASSFVFISTMAVFYRSAKALLAVAVLALLFHVRGADQRQRTAQRPARVVTRDAVLACALGLVAGLLDRQGFVYVLAGCLIVTLHAFWTNRLRDVLLGLVVAAGILVAYNYVLAPVAIRALNGYWPNFSYQRIPLPDAFILVVYAGLAAKMLVENAALLAGGSHAIAALLVGALIVVCLLSGGVTSSRWWSLPDVRRRLAFRPNRRVVAYLALGFGTQVFMFALMIARHPYVYTDLDHRYWYYPLPFAMTVLFAAMSIFDVVIRWRTPAIVPAIRGLLIAMIVGNLAFVPVRRQVMGAGNWFKVVFAQSAALERSLDTGTPDALLEPSYRRFFELHARWSTE
jgi:hypothetical protein